MFKNTKTDLLFLIGLGIIFFIPFLGGVHLFDWDEINFAEISREMLLTEDYLRIYVDFVPFWEKPPLYFWLQALSMKSFGFTEFAARLPNAICGIITLVFLYKIGDRLYNRLFGFFWAIVYFGTILPNLYSHSGIIDPWFNLFIFSGLYFFIQFNWKKNGLDTSLLKSKWIYLFWGGFLIGLGILTKGQVAYLVTCVTFFIYWIYKRFRFYVNVPEFLFFTFAATLVSLTWYGLETWKNGPWFISEFNKYQYRLFSTPDAGHKGFFGYHFAVLLVGCFPASIFLIRSFFKMPEFQFDYQKDFTKWMKMFFWVVLILFSVVQSKIVHYSSLCYFPLTYLATLVIYNMVEQKINFDRWIKIGLLSIGGLFVIATIALPFVGMNSDILKPLFNDPFALGNLDAAVHWSGWDIIPGLFFLTTLVYSIFFLKSKKRILALFLGTAIFINLTLYFLVGNIEHHSQRAAIEFFESKAGEDCYIKPMGYKTYAHLWYGKRPNHLPVESRDIHWLMSEKADKPVYVITKVHKLKKLAEFGNLREIGRKNGFVFLKKDILLDQVHPPK
ncbi:MAG: 4-amino-4-deoxy-L-arabinose transferase-like glycosyltransferase [Saprospiraceae bacterium]